MRTRLKTPIATHPQFTILKAYVNYVLFVSIGIDPEIACLNFKLPEIDDQSDWLKRKLAAAALYRHRCYSDGTPIHTPKTVTIQVMHSVHIDSSTFEVRTFQQR